MDFDEFCRRLENLRIDQAKPPPKPYKPLLLAAVVVLIAKGKIRSREILLDGGLRSAFKQLLAVSYPDWPYRADVKYPFRHLENDGIWTLHPIEEALERYVTARAAGAPAQALLAHVACARLDERVFETLAASADARQRVLSIVLGRYGLPARTAELVRHVLGNAATIDAPRDATAEADWSERVIEEYLVEHWRSTPFARMGVALSRPERDGLPARQVLTPVNAIDLLGFQPAARMWWVFELKRGRPADAVVGQISRYLGWIAEHGRGRGQTAHGVILAGGADHKLTYAVRAHERLSLWTYDAAIELTQVV